MRDDGEEDVERLRGSICKADADALVVGPLQGGMTEKAIRRGLNMTRTTPQRGRAVAEQGIFLFFREKENLNLLKSFAIIQKK